MLKKNGELQMKNDIEMTCTVSVETRIFKIRLCEQK